MDDASPPPSACPRCGATMPADATDGVCPRCLLEEAQLPSEGPTAIATVAGTPGEQDWSGAATMRVAAPMPSMSQPRREVDLPLPEELTMLLPAGAYLVEGFLGQGGMGAVYKGVQVRLKRAVAIKIMRRDFGKDMDFEARFEREAQAMAKLNHPNIVSVIDFGEAGADYLYIVMELVEGADMMDVIRGGQMTQEMALSLLPQICDALQFAHDNGIVHRDIKPSNIMLTRDGRIKMADFGLAKRYDAEDSFRTQTGTGMGTPDYAAPEQFDPRASIDHRADIYALGVMIYQMITGQLPRGVWKAPSERAKVAPEWDGIVSRAMQNDPADRYQKASEVKTDVSGILLTPASAPTAGPPARKDGAATKPKEAARSGQAEVAKAPARSRGPMLFGLMAGAVVLALGTFLALRKSDENKGAAPAAAPPGLSSSPSSPATATKDAPFVNSLGMKFVPVQITGGPTNGQRVLFSIWETRVQDYEVFTKETKHEGAKPDFEQGPAHPAVMVSWQDAKAFCEWLTERERNAGSLDANEAYRLPSDHEWSCSIGIGDKEDASQMPMEGDRKMVDVYPWGRAWPPPPRAGNYAGEELQQALADGLYPRIPGVIAGYRDSHVTTASVGSYLVNHGGIYDLGGNAREWCEDWVDAKMEGRVLRGASWSHAEQVTLLSCARFRGNPVHRDPSYGFRVVLAPAPSEPPKTASATPATKDAPLVNSLGMKFVSVPGTGILMCIHETRRQDYAAYAEGKPEVPTSWQNVNDRGVPVGDKPDHPVCNVSWDESRDFCRWLSQKEGRSYRLPTDEEWSVAIGIAPKEKRGPGVTPRQLFETTEKEFSWGGPFPPPAGSLAGNYGDATFEEKVFPGHEAAFKDYRDGFATTAPVMSFKPNKLGIYDLSGNAFEWVEDFFDQGAGDGRVLRGGSYNGNDSFPNMLSTSGRRSYSASAHLNIAGFRVVMEEKAGVPAAATK